MNDVQNLEEKDIEGKNVLLRTDINLPIEDGEPQPTVRFDRYMKTIEKLSDRGARIMVIAHQGRPARNDFLSLEEHSRLMGEYLDQNVRFVQSFFGPQLGDSVASMDNGEVVLLENIRFLSEELQNVSAKNHSQDYFIENMQKYFDIYVNDAFSAAHRSHGSLVGFNSALECYPGPLMRKELESCKQIRDDIDNPLLVLGGEKPSDIIGMMTEMIEKVDKVLLGGIPGELALMIKGNNLGEKEEWISQNGFDSSKSELEDLLQKYSEKIVVPKDLTTDSGNYDSSEVPEDEMTWDIGDKTIQEYVNTIEDADSLVMKGPMGAFEKYPDGTKEVVDAIAESDAYTVLGGGHTSSLVQRFDHEIDDFEHISIAGGAFVRFMSGENLPAIDALNEMC